MMQLIDVERRFSTGFRLGPLSRRLGPGLVHLVGPNGSGKSTLLRLMAGALRPSAGRVLVQGQDVHQVPAARAAVGWVPAALELPPFLTVREAWQTAAGLRGLRWSGEPLEQALGVPPHLRLSQASSGQRRKAQLLAALVGDPPVLLLDETLAHLDDHATAWLLAQIDRWRQDRLVVLTHHGPCPLPPEQEWSLERGSQPLEQPG